MLTLEKKQSSLIDKREKYEKAVSKPYSIRTVCVGKDMDELGMEMFNSNAKGPREMQAIYS